MSNSGYVKISRSFMDRSAADTVKIKPIYSLGAGIWATLASYGNDDWYVQYRSGEMVVRIEPATLEEYEKGI